MQCGKRVGKIYLVFISIEYSTTLALLRAVVIVDSVANYNLFVTFLVFLLNFDFIRCVKVKV